MFRHGPSEEGTVALPKDRVSVATESVCLQTDPIADKGFGVSLLYTLFFEKSKLFSLIFVYYSVPMANGAVRIRQRTTKEKSVGSG